MADAGHEATEKILQNLEKRIGQEFATATREMEAKLQAYLEKTEKQRKVQDGLLKEGKITKQEYSDWCFRHNMVGKRWEQMRDTLAEDMHHTNEIAKGIMEKRMPDVYALNANYATYQIEHDARIDTGFTLYNHDTAEYLLGDQRQLMPAPSAKKAREIAANADMQWNKQKIQSAVLQGVLQGESPYNVAQRLRSVGQMNYNASVRYARTMTTSAQNAGRYEAYRRARDLGVDLTIEWQATLDHRTRHAHRMMHGQRTEVDEPFHTPDGYTIYYPADCTGESTAPQKEIWNCRCTLLSWVKGFEGDTVKSSPKMGDMTFEEWQSGKGGFTDEQKPSTIDKWEYLKKANPYIDTNKSRSEVINEWKAMSTPMTSEDRYNVGVYCQTANSFQINKAFKDLPVGTTIDEVKAQGLLPEKWCDRLTGMERLMNDNALEKAGQFTRRVSDGYAERVLGIKRGQVDAILLNFDHPKVQEELGKIVGKRVTELGYMSVAGSDDPEWSCFGYRNVELHLFSDKGKPCIITNPDELEVVFGRGTEYEIKGFSKKSYLGYGTKLIVDCMILR